jgi:hypothetical protein
MQTPSIRMFTAAALLIGTLVAGPLATPAGAAAPDEADAIEVFARDVFVVVGSTLRNPTATTGPGEPLFNVAGINLDVTWGEWSEGFARSVARSSGDRSDVRLELTGLIPGGIYSIFYGTIGPDSENPLCPGVERTLPLTAFHAERQVPDASSFVAGPDGTASYRGRVDASLLDAQQSFLSVIYHADGSTYGPVPNRGEWLTQGENCRSSFGHDAMRQFLVLQKW